MRRIVQDLEAEAEPFREGTNRVFAGCIVDAHRNDVHASRSVRPIQLLHARHLDFAWLAPRRPHVEQHNFAAVVGERSDGARAQILRSKVRRRRPVSYRKQVVGEQLHASEQSGAK